MINKFLVYFLILFALFLVFDSAQAQTTKTTKKQDIKNKKNESNNNKLGVDPSILAAEIKIKGHENEKKNSSNDTKLNVKDPSVHDLERKIRIAGHEKEPLEGEKKKLNLTEPSVDEIEKQLRVQGHNLSESTKDEVKKSVVEPSVNEAEKQLKVSGHENETGREDKRHFKMNPGVDNGLAYDNPRFKYARMIEKRQQKLKHVVPSDDQLEKLIEITNGSLNEQPKINRSDILPSYQGFQGVLMHDDETFLNNETELVGTARHKPADLDDFKKWMDKQGNESKLERFKRLDDEFERLNKRMEDHDDFKRNQADSDKDAGPKEKLKRAIREIEKEQEARKRRKMDL